MPRTNQYQDEIDATQALRDLVPGMSQRGFATAVDGFQRENILAFARNVGATIDAEQEARVRSQVSTAAAANWSTIYSRVRRYDTKRKQQLATAA